MLRAASTREKTASPEVWAHSRVCSYTYVQILQAAAKAQLPCLPPLFPSMLITPTPEPARLATDTTEGPCVMISHLPMVWKQHTVSRKLRTVIFPQARICGKTSANSPGAAAPPPPRGKIIHMLSLFCTRTSMLFPTENSIQSIIWWSQHFIIK